MIMACASCGRLRQRVAALEARVAKIEAAAARGVAAASPSSAAATLLTYAVEDDAADARFQFALREPQLPFLRANPLCVALVEEPQRGAGGEDAAPAQRLLACGSADATLRIIDWRTCRTVSEVKLSAAVLSLACSPVCDAAAGGRRLVAAGCMDGTLNVVALASGGAIELLQTNQCHVRYVVALRWSAGGRYLATGSWDHSCVVFAATSLDGAAFAEPAAAGGASAGAAGAAPPPPPTAPPLVRLKKFLFECHVESVEFIAPDTADRAEESAEDSARDSVLVIAVAESADLFHVALPAAADYSSSGSGGVPFEWRLRPLNLNARGDAHVSFSAMDLRRSPAGPGARSGRFLLVATDKGRVLLLRGGTTEVLRTFVGHTAGDLSHPRVAWSPCGRYALSNTEESGTVYVWSVATARVVRRIGNEDASCRASHCHRSAVRSLDVAAAADGTILLATCAFDKRAKVWVQAGYTKY
jgi:hypothetical protein